MGDSIAAVIGFVHKGVPGASNNKLKNDSQQQLKDDVRWDYWAGWCGQILVCEG